MRRKLNRRGAATQTPAPAPEPAPTPEPAAPVAVAPAPVATTPVEVLDAEPAPAQLPATTAAPASEETFELAPLSPELLDLLGFDAPEIDLGEEHVEFPPRVGFKSGKERDAQAGLLREALGNVAPGTPYLQHGKDAAYPLAGAVVIQLREFYFCADRVWDDEEGEYYFAEAYLTPQKDAEGRDREGERGRRLSDSMIAVQLVLPGRDPLDDALAPGVVAVSVFDGPRYNAAVGMARAIGKAKSPAFAKRYGVVATAPPRVRVVGELYGSKPAGKSYIKGHVTTRAADLETLAAFSRWSQDPGAQAQLATALEYFEAECDAVREVAAETAGK